MLGAVVTGVFTGLSSSIVGGCSLGMGRERLLLVELLELLLIGDVTVASAGWRGSFVDAACL